MQAVGRWLHEDILSSEVNFLPLLMFIVHGVHAPSNK
jgi:hypothetical protein